MTEDPSFQPSTRRPILLIVAGMIAAVALSLGYTTWAVHESQAGQQRLQSAQQRQGQAVNRKLCRTMDALAALVPPPGNPAANPSRAFDDRMHATLDELAPDLGCAP